MLPLPMTLRKMLDGVREYVAEHTANFSSMTPREQFAECAYRFMHVLTIRGLARLSRQNVAILERDLAEWIARDRELSGELAMEAYGLPGYDYYYSETGYPDDLTGEHQMAEMHGFNLDMFRDRGIRISGAVFEMVKKEIADGNEEYFQKFHHLICFMDCYSIDYCLEMRKDMNKEYKVTIF